MATSYKALWQEANEEIEGLKAKIQELRQRNTALSSVISSGRTLHGETRQIVDLAGIARHMQVERYTPQQWQQRDLLPPRDFPEIREPLWYASSIIEGFCIPTGRRWYNVPVEELSPVA